MSGTGDVTFEAEIYEIETERFKAEQLQPCYTCKHPKKDHNQSSSVFSPGNYCELIGCGCTGFLPPDIEERRAEARRSLDRDTKEYRRKVRQRVAYMSSDEKVTESIHCDECHVVDLARYGHHWNCSKADTTWEQKAEYWKQAYQRMLKMNDQNTKAFRRLNEQVTLWQGKFKAVKHENNQLRKKFQQARVRKRTLWRQLMERYL